MQAKKEGIVRWATPADEVAILNLLITMHREGFWRIVPYDYEKITLAIERGTRNKGGMIGVIDDIPKRPGYTGIRASIGLSIEEWFGSRDCYLQQRWLYVRPEYRRLGYDAALMAWGLECRRAIDEDPAKKQRSPFLLAGSYIDNDPRRAKLKDRLWSRWGKKVGSVFFSGLPDL